MTASKNNYEMYDYLTVPTSSAAETHPDQFFIVQDDGTLFINKQVQYVTQVPNGPETSDAVVQRCSIYDIAPQQVFVDVDNSSELISVSGNLVLPDGSNSIYTNSYLMQELPSSSSSQDQEACLSNTTTDQYQDGVLVMDEQFKHDEIKEANFIYAPSPPDKQVTNCTEITLNEEQYKMLQEKGWVLLETSEKTYVLDTLGLHDITNNEDIIQQLKNEIQNVPNYEEAKSVSKQVDVTSTQDSNENKPMQIDNICENQVLQSNVERDIKVAENLPPPLIPISQRQEEDKPHQESIEINKTPSEQKDLPKISDSDTPGPRKVIKLKTTLAAKDIPDSIYLGKTVNGKKLIARVVKPIVSEDSEVGNQRNDNNSNETETLMTKSIEVVDKTKKKDALSNIQNLDNFEGQFESLLDDLLKNPKENSDSQDFFNIVSNVKHLLSIPVFKQSVDNHNIVVTKVTEQKKDNIATVTVSPTVVPGKIVHLQNSCEFVHIPHILKCITEGRSNTSLNEFLHVHITETKNGDTTKGVSVTMQKRPVPLNSRSKEKKKAFACGSCASIFLTELALRGHQKHCLKLRKILKNDSDEQVKSETDLDETNNSESNEKYYYSFKSPEGTSHVCMECKMVFNKLSNCKRHVKTHIPQAQLKESDKDSEKTKSYKCNMCPNAYYHPSTLSKHIVQSHIQNKLSL